MLAIAVHSRAVRDGSLPAAAQPCARVITQTCGGPPRIAGAREQCGRRRLAGRRPRLRLRQQADMAACNRRLRRSATGGVPRGRPARSPSTRAWRATIVRSVRRPIPRRAPRCRSASCRPRRGARSSRRRSPRTRARGCSDDTDRTTAHRGRSTPMSDERTSALRPALPSTGRRVPRGSASRAVTRCESAARVRTERRLHRERLEERRSRSRRRNQSAARNSGCRSIASMAQRSAHVDLRAPRPGGADHARSPRSAVAMSNHGRRDEESDRPAARVSVR